MGLKFEKEKVVETPPVPDEQMPPLPPLPPEDNDVESNDDNGGGKEKQIKEIFVFKKKTIAQIVIEALALWNTVWSLLVFNMRQMFPATDGLDGSIIAVTVAGIGNILGIIVAQWRSNAESIMGLKKKKDKIIDITNKNIKLKERIDEYAARHLHDVAMGVMYEAEVAIARGEETGKFLAERMKKELGKIEAVANAARKILTE